MDGACLPWHLVLRPGRSKPEGLHDRRQRTDGSRHHQFPLLQPPPVPVQRRCVEPFELRWIENVFELWRDWAVTVKLSRVAAATPTVASATGAPSTTGRPVEPSWATV